MRIRRGWLGVGALPALLVVLGLTTLTPGRHPEASSLEDLTSRLAECPEQSSPCAHLVYVHAPSLPLSERGTVEITEAAVALDVPVTALRAEALFARSSDPAAEALRQALVEAGATVHYPAVVVTHRGKPLGNAVVGYRRAAAYRAVLSERLGSLDPGGAVPPAPALPAAADTGRDVRVLLDIELPGRPGAFFRRVPGTRRISFDVRSTVYLHHLETGERFRAPGRLDFVPSPDGLFFVTPAARNGGTEFYDRLALFELGARAEGRSLEPLLVDETMNDEYPSVGILERSDAGQPTRYRMLVAWYRGPAYRDYDVDVGSDGSVASVTPLGRKTPVCPGRDLSLPILSKDGLEMSARDESTGTTKVFRVGPGRCQELLDIGMQTSKATFSEDGRRLAFGARSGSAGADEGGSNAVYVFDRDTRAVMRIPESASASLTIPEFVGPDSLLFLVTPRARQAPMSLRLVCCVR